MTDLEKFENLLEEFGIPVGLKEVSEYGDFDLVIKEISDATRVIISNAGYTKGKIEGYSEFYTTWTFENNGKFKKVGIWE